MNDDDIAQWPARAVDAAMRAADIIAPLPPKERAKAYKMFDDFARHDIQAQESENEDQRRVSE